MSNQSGKLKQRLSSIVVDNQDINELKIMTTAAIGISVIIIQAFISAGITDSNASVSVVGFSVAIPLLALFLFVISTRKVTSILASIILAIILTIGSMAFTLGIITTFYHLSLIAGNVFLAVTLISLLIFFLLDKLK